MSYCWSFGGWLIVWDVDLFINCQNQLCNHYHHHNSNGGGGGGSSSSSSIKLFIMMIDKNKDNWFIINAYIFSSYLWMK